MTQEAWADEQVRQNVELLKAHCDPQSTLKAAGMAYPQLSSAAAGNFRVFAVKMGMPDLKAENVPDDISLFVNCTVEPVESEGKVDRREICFSAPGVAVIIERWKSVIVHHPDGRAYRYDDIDAWGIQHENDHADGILCQHRALEQGRKLYYAPTEVAQIFLREGYDPSSGWPEFPAEQWWAMTTGELALESYIGYL